MREKIKRLSHGEFEYELPRLVIYGDDPGMPLEMLEFQVEAGQIFGGKLRLCNSKGRKMKGLVYCESAMLSLKNPAFDSEEAVVSFEFDAEAYKVGETVKFSLFIISEFGEVKLPVKASVTARSLMASLGDIRDLFHFANLAQSDWQEARSVFKSPEFEQVFLYKDEKNSMIYRGLIKSHSLNHALEEFLISIHKKHKVNLYLSESRKTFKEPVNTIEDIVTLKRNQWGYAEIQVYSDVDFIIPEYGTIWPDSFIRDEYNVKYVINPEKIGMEDTEGHLFFRTEYQTIKLSIKIEKSSENIAHKKNGTKQMFKMVRAKSVKNYLDFRMGNLTLEAYEKRMDGLLSQITGKSEEWYGIYLRIQMALLTGKKASASQLLLNCDHRFSKSRFGVFPASEFQKNKIDEQEISVEEYCTYVYFKTLLLRDKAITQRAVETIREFYGQGYEDSFLLWFLIYLDTRYETNPSLVVREVMEHISMGSTSPILFYEVYSRYQKQPELLRDSGSENLWVMSFASRYGGLKGELLKHFLHRAGLVKGYDALLYIILKRMYKKSPNLEVLSVAVQMLIKGHKSGPEYFFWFEDGVKENLNITELYEYYLASVDWDSEPVIPEVVFSYFRYHRNMSRSQKIMFYNYIVNNADKMLSVYEAYADDIREFSIKELESGNANRIMGPLYEKALESGNLTENAVNQLPRLMFLYEFSTDCDDIEGVYVRHKELDDEIYYPVMVKQGIKKAVFPIATENYCIFPVNKRGNRFLETIKYSLTRIFDFERFIGDSLDAATNEPMMLLHLLEQTESYHKNIIEEPVLYRNIIKLESLDTVVFKRCNMRLIKHYYDQFAVELLDECLKEIDLSIYSFGERKTLIEYFMIRDMLDEALMAVKTYGTRGLTQKRVMRLCSKVLQRDGIEEFFSRKKEDYRFTEIAFRVFLEVKCDPIVLEYLEKCYCGNTDSMLKLWKEVHAAGLLSHNLGERILSQVLFTEGSISEVFPVFTDYYKKGDNKRLILAYLSYSSYKYLVRDRILPDGIFGIIEDAVLREPEDIIVLALLKYYSERDLTEQQLQIADYQMSRMIDKNLVFPFFKKFKNELLVPQGICNKYFVEYHTNPSHKVTIHYYMENKDNSGSYQSVQMKQVYEGIFIKDFLLFYGEELLYYITEEGEDGDNITESTRVRMESLYEEEENQYNLINLMLLSRQMQDEKALLELMENYIRTEYSTKLFRPIED